MSITRTVLIVIGVIVAIAAIAAASLAIRYYTAEIRGRVGAEEQIESAPSRIARYEEFFNLCASVQSREQALEAQRRRMANSEGADDRELSRIRSNIAGLESQRARAINRYNARAAQAYTAARFLASNLPPKLSHETENTTCAISN